MCVYEVTQSRDGVLFLTSVQIDDLKRKGFDSTQIHSALLKLYEASRRDVPDSEDASHLPPCPDCGGTEFLPTGNCHACAICGASQGCSWMNNKIFPSILIVLRYFLIVLAMFCCRPILCRACAANIESEGLPYNSFSVLNLFWSFFSRLLFSLRRKIKKSGLYLIKRRFLYFYIKSIDKINIFIENNLSFNFIKEWYGR